MFRKILGTIGGVVVGMVLIEVMLRVGQSLFPPPGVDSADREALQAAVRSASVPSLLWVALSWFVGTFAGVLVAQKASRVEAHERWPATTVEAFLLALALLNLMTLRPPGWFWVVGLAMFPLAYFGGVLLARRR